MRNGGRQLEKTMNTDDMLDAAIKKAHDVKPAIPEDGGESSSDSESESGEKPQWEPNPEFISKDVCFYPEDVPGSTDFRRTWYMQRNKRLLIPSPTGTVMPDKVKDEEKKAKLYSLYLRPWVLREADQIRFVPHILNLPSVRRELGREHLRVWQKQPDWSWENAWRTYIRGHVVSEHSRRLIVQFMAACCGKSTTHDEDDEEGDQKVKDYDQPTNEMAVGRVHDILKCMSAEEEKSKLKKKPVQASKSTGVPNTADPTLEDEELEEGSIGRTGLHMSNFRLLLLYFPVPCSLYSCEIPDVHITIRID